MGKRQGAGGRSLQVFGALERGGAETWFLDAARGRGDSRWSADVCLLADREGACVEEARALGLRVVACPYRPAASFPARFYRLLRKERYDAVHAHVLLFGGVVAAIATRAGVPLRIAHAHNSSDGRPDTPVRELYRSAMRRAIASHANLVLACSTEAAKAFGTPSTAVLPYGVDLGRFVLPGLVSKSDLGVPAEAHLALAAGRLCKQKNHTLLLDALRECPDKGLHLAIAGEGELRSRLESEIAARGLGERVHLLGLRNDVPALLCGAADAYVMPSLHEGLPVALLEAQAAGLPCLVSSSISTEAMACAEQVETLPLDARLWGQKMALAVRRRRLDRAAAAQRLRMAGLDNHGAWVRMTALYEAALHTGQRAHAA
ncbi:MAG: glycosyltransferase [Bryobacterales bacterium]